MAVYYEHFDHFTDKARKVMQIANQEAQRFNHDEVDTAHILLGLIKEGTSAGIGILLKRGIDLRSVRHEVERQTPTGEDTVMMGRLPLTDDAAAIVEYATGTAQIAGQEVSTEHILLALLQVDGVAVKVLHGLGIPLDGFRNDVIHLIRYGDVVSDWSK